MKSLKEFKRVISTTALAFGLTILLVGYENCSRPTSFTSNASQSVLGGPGSTLDHITFDLSVPNQANAGDSFTIAAQNIQAFYTDGTNLTAQAIDPNDSNLSVQWTVS